MKNEIGKYSIGETSSISGISVQTLRYYDSVCLLRPEFVDENNNYRYYSDDNVVTLMWIKQLRKLDFSLKEIRNIISSDNRDNLVEELAVRQKELENEKKMIQKKCQTVKELQLLLKESQNEKKTAEIVEKTYEKRSVISIIRQGVCEKENYTIWYAELIKIAEEYGLHITGEFSIKYFDNIDDFDRYHAKIEASATVQEKKSDCPCFHTEESFTGIAKLYQGSYIEIRKGYAGFREYIAEKGYKMPDCFMFRYLVNRAHTKKENEYRTEIILPIEKNT